MGFLVFTSKSNEDNSTQNFIHHEIWQKLSNKKPKNQQKM